MTDEIKNDVSACSTSTTRIASRGSQDAFAPKKPLMSFVPSAAAADAARRIRARRSLVARRWHPSQSVRKFSRPRTIRTVMDCDLGLPNGRNFFWCHFE